MRFNDVYSHHSFGKQLFPVQLVIFSAIPVELVHDRKRSHWKCGYCLVHTMKYNFCLRS